MIAVILEGQQLVFDAPSMTPLALKPHSQQPERPEAPIVGALVDGEIIDLTRPLFPRVDPYLVEFITTDSVEGLSLLRHSTSHVMTQATLRLFGDGVHLGVGPATDDGFYQDFDLPELSEADLPRIEAEMLHVVREANPFERSLVSKAEALALFADDPLKCELIAEIPSNTLSVYRQREHLDLCTGPHLPHTAALGAFKLLRVTSAYWRGDAQRQQLKRIYGITYPTQAQLDAELYRRAEAERRDHRRVGSELGLFLFTDYAPGAPIFLPSGTVIYNGLVELKRTLMRKWGYGEIRTPTLLKRQLWETSGHWEHYREHMFSLQADGEDFAVKPMNCPGSTLVYRARPRSYRELPLRLGEFGYVHRNEMSGALAGLLRVRAFTQDDAHLYVAPEQISSEIVRTVQMYQELYDVFGLQTQVALSTRPAKRMGAEALWDHAEQALQHALETLTLPYEVKAGDGAFYGPKIDFQIRDSLGRAWQCGTIQLDFQLPEQFDLHYIGDDGKPHRPVMIHPAAMGSIERFMALLIEEFDGYFPTWLAPVQVLILPISQKSSGYAQTLIERLVTQGFRAETDTSDEPLGKKIRAAHRRRVPYILVVGPHEAQHQTVSVRDRHQQEKRGVPVDAFLRCLADDVTQRRCMAYNVNEFSL